MAARNFCSSCGLRLDAGSAFCGNCGARVPSSAPASAAQPVSPSPLSEQAETSGVLNTGVSKNAQLQPQAQTVSKTVVPAYAGTLFGTVPTSSGEMFSSTTFTDEEPPAREWYERTWVVVLFLVLFWIIGMILLWRNKYLTTGQKIAFSLISSIVDYFLYYVLLSSLLASSYGLASAPRQGVAGDYASHSDSSTASATSVSPNPTSSPSSARSASPQQTIDFASPSDVYASIGVIREGCLSNGNNYCAAICQKYQETIIDVNKALTQNYFIDPNTREPNYASTFQSYYQGCKAAANN